MEKRIKSPNFVNIRLLEEKKQISFIQRQNAPEIIYKYRDWSKDFHKRNLEGKLYFVSASSFNDPFDSRMPMSIDLLSNNSELTNELDYLVKRINYSYETRGFPRKDVATVKDKIDFLYEYIESEFAIFCISSVRDSILMWTHYADSHKGFVIGFDTRILVSELETLHGPVNYVSEITPKNINSFKLFNAPFAKHESWYYEEEWRFIKENRDWINKEFDVSTNAIREVLLGYKMPQKHKIELIEYCKLNLPHVVIMEATLAEDRFKLEFLPLH
jgi:hypothetical protein